MRVPCGRKAATLSVVPVSWWIRAARVCPLGSVTGMTYTRMVAYILQLRINCTFPVLMSRAAPLHMCNFTQWESIGQRSHFTPVRRDTLETKFYINDTWLRWNIFVQFRIYSCEGPCPIVIWIPLSVMTRLGCVISSLAITVASTCKAWIVFVCSNTRIVGSNPTRGMDAFVSVVLSVGRSFETSWSPFQVVTPTVYRIKKLECRLRPNEGL
jgi:hypothetical protein